MLKEFIADEGGCYSNLQARVPEQSKRTIRLDDNAVLWQKVFTPVSS